MDAGQVLLLAIRTNKAGKRLLRLDAATRELIREVQPGGVILYAQNMQNSTQVRALVREIRDLCRIPPFIAIDEEGGRVSRLKASPGIGATVIPPARELAAAGPAAVGVAYDIIGSDLAALGFTMNFAPVLDLDFNPAEVYLGDRSFGLDPALVSKAGMQAMEALHRHGVVAVAKHFPGHGRSRGDSHFGIHIVKASATELELDLSPFRSLIANGLAAMMSSHLRYPALDPADQPASLSSAILTDLARSKLGFRGLMMTDAFEMKGLNSGRSEVDAARAALIAGSDMIMSPADPRSMKASLEKAAAADPALASSLERAYQAIMKTKERFGILQSRNWVESDVEAQRRIKDPAKAKRLREALATGRKG